MGRLAKRRLIGVSLMVAAAWSCGQTSQESSEEKIYGGTQVDADAWSSTVAITNSSSGVYCTGTAVHPRLVITAGHCVMGQNPERLKVYTGQGKAGGKISGKFEVEKLASSPQYSYSWGSKGNDIAYLLLKTPLELPREAYISVLTDPDEIKELLTLGAKATLVGFGNRDDGGYGQKFQVETQIVNKIGASLGIDDKTEVYIGGGGKDTCQGDSGGPAYGQLKSGEWRVYGVTSRGGSCGTGGIYGLMHANICWIQTDSGVDLQLPEGACKHAQELD